MKFNKTRVQRRELPRAIDAITAAERLVKGFGKSAVFESLAILYPTRRQEWDLDAMSDDLEELFKKQLGGTNEQRYLAVAYVSRLALITADQVEVTDQGIKLYYEQALSKQPALPDRSLIS